MLAGVLAYYGFIASLGVGRGVPEGVETGDGGKTGG
jgi:hypothetical protein